MPLIDLYTALSDKMGLVRGDMAGLDDFMATLQGQLGERWAELTS